MLVTSGEQGGEEHLRRARARRWHGPQRYGWAAMAVVISSAVCWAGSSVLSAADQAMVYLLGVLIVASRLPRRSSLLAAVLGVAALRLLLRAAALHVRRERPALLRDLHGDAGGGAARQHVHRAPARAGRGSARARAAHGGAVRHGAAVRGRDRRGRDRARGRRARARAARGRGDRAAGRPGRQPDALRRRRVRARQRRSRRWPSRAGPSSTGAWPGTARTRCRDPRRSTSRWSAAAGTSGPSASPSASVPTRRRPRSGRSWRPSWPRRRMALERALLVERAASARVAAETERTRSALLSAVSHDLRTPLASIAGAASALTADTGLDEERARRAARNDPRGVRAPLAPDRRPPGPDAPRIRRPDGQEGALSPRGDRRLGDPAPGRRAAGPPARARAAGGGPGRSGGPAAARAGARQPARERGQVHARGDARSRCASRARRARR